MFTRELTAGRIAGLEKIQSELDAFKLAPKQIHTGLATMR
jgi:hypothetical protein